MAYKLEDNSSQSSNDLPICPVCTDFLVDPYPLPCGHSFCGPAKSCLKLLQRPSDMVKCAICKKKHRLNINELKPLYGIREHLQQCSSQIDEYKKEIEELKQKVKTVQNQQSFEPPICSQKLCKNGASFWCKECELGICDDCLEADHDKHSVVSFKKHLRCEVEKKLTRVRSSAFYEKRGIVCHLCSLVQLKHVIDHTSTLQV